MTGPHDDPRMISDRRVSLPPEFAIADHVQKAAAFWPVRIQPVEHYLCKECHRQIGIKSADGEQYQYTDGEFTGLVLSHLMQNHGWTREHVGTN